MKVSLCKCWVKVILVMKERYFVNRPTDDVTILRRWQPISLQLQDLLTVLLLGGVRSGVGELTLMIFGQSLIFYLVCVEFCLKLEGKLNFYLNTLLKYTIFIETVCKKLITLIWYNIELRGLHYFNHLLLFIFWEIIKRYVLKNFRKSLWSRPKSIKDNKTVKRQSSKI